MKVKMKTIPRDYDKTITLQEGLFYGFFILLSLTKGLGFYEGQKVFILLTAAALLLGFLKLLVTPYTKRQAAVQILLFMMTAAMYVSSRELAVLFVAFTIMGMKGISLKKTLHIALWVWSLCAVSLSVFSFFGWSTQSTAYMRRWGLGIFSAGVWALPIRIFCISPI